MQKILRDTKLYYASFIEPETLDIVKNIKGMVFDFDGVFTDNTELIGDSVGEVLKFRSHYDGQGISLLRAIGIRIMIATNASGVGANSICQLVNKWNNLPSVKSGAWSKVELATSDNCQIDKVKVTQEWLTEMDLPKEECGVMGDDLVDIPIFEYLDRFRAAPRTAEKIIRDKADFISKRPGGNGAVRDLVNFILRVRGVDPASLNCY